MAAVQRRDATSVAASVRRQSRGSRRGSRARGARPSSRRPPKRAVVRLRRVERGVHGVPEVADVGLERVVVRGVHATRPRRAPSTRPNPPNRSSRARRESRRRRAARSPRSPRTPPRIPARPRASRPRASRTPSRRPRPRRHTSRLRRGAGRKAPIPTNRGPSAGPRVAGFAYAASRDVARELRRRGFPLASPRMRAPSSSRSSRLNAGSTSASRGDRRARAPTSSRCAGRVRLRRGGGSPRARRRATVRAPARAARCAKRRPVHDREERGGAADATSIEAASVAPTPTVARARCARAAAGQSRKREGALACDGDRALARARPPAGTT